MNPNTITCGNALDVLASWPKECVDMVITSPPYWGLRAYDCPPQIWGGGKNCNHDWNTVYKPPTGGNNPPDRPANVGANQDLNNIAGVRGKGSYSDFCNKCGAWKGHLGLEPDFRMYIDHLMQIFREVRRVLKNSGSLWVNIGDSYAGSNCGRNDYRENKSLQKDIYNKPSPQSRASRFSKWGRDGEGGELGNCLTQKETPGIKAKSMIGIPERFSLAMIDDGWARTNTIIWAKQILYQDNTTSGAIMPGSFQGRFNQSFEYLYCFAKGEGDTCWKDRETGQWVFEKPQENPVLYWVNRDTQETSITNPAPDALAKSGKSKLWRSVRKWMGFDSYFDLDTVRVPFTENERKRCLERGASFVGGRKNPQGEFKHCNCQQCRPRMGNRGGQETLYDSKSAPEQLGPKDFATEQEYRQYIRAGKHYNHKGKESEYGLAPKHSWEREGFKLQDGAPGREPCGFERKGHSGNCDKEGNLLIHLDGKCPPTVWAINTIGFPGHHFAVYPETLLERPIKACCPPNGTVLDPFMGSGTTTLVALSLGRKFVGIDASQKYVDMARKRIEDKLPLLAGDKNG